MSELEVNLEWVADKMSRSVSTISHWLTGRREPKLEEIKELAAVLGINYISMMASDAGEAYPYKVSDNKTSQYTDNFVTQNDEPFAKTYSLKQICYVDGGFMETGEIVVAESSEYTKEDKIFIMPNASMLPRIAAGSWLIIRKNATIINGLLYLGQGDDGEVVGAYDEYKGERFLINSIRREPVNSIYGKVIWVLPPGFRP